MNGSDEPGDRRARTGSRRTSGWLCASCIVWLAACGQTDSGESETPSMAGSGAEHEPDVESSGDESSSLNPSCSSDADCALPDPAVLFDLFSVPSRVPAPFAASRCEGVSVEPMVPGPRVEGPQCSCLDEYGNAIRIGPVGLDTCFAPSRDGGCLFDGSDFAGCDVSAPGGCDGVCATLHERLAADAARTIEVQLLGTPCVESQCYLALQTNERCVLDGQKYDCDLTPGEAVAERLHPPQLPTLDAVPFTYGDPREIPGVSGTVSLYHRRRVAGTTVVEDTFAGWSRFYSIPDDTGSLVGEIIDPLEGADDCGVFRSYGYEQAVDAPSPRRAPTFAAREQTLLDGTVRYPDFGREGLDLGALGALPRFGGSYAFEAVGVGGSPSLHIEGPRLPEALVVETLEAQSRVARDALPLTWTGSGDALLYIYLDVFKQLGSSSLDYSIACRVVDDGAFTIPKSVMQAVPPGFVIADFTRQNRDQPSSGDYTLLALGTEWVTHDFALSAGCERPEVVTACQNFGNTFVEASIECGQGVPAAADLCPDYLIESCEACPEYFECRRRSTRCVNGQLESPAGCYCP